MSVYRHRSMSDSDFFMSESDMSKIDMSAHKIEKLKFRQNMSESDIFLSYSDIKMSDSDICLQSRLPRYTITQNSKKNKKIISEKPQIKIILLIMIQ